MARALYTNLAAGTLASGISSNATSITLNAGQGSLFPTPTNGDYAYITLSDAATGNNIEIVQCTGRAGDVLTVIRGVQNTSPLSFLANDNVQLRITSGGMTELSASATHGFQLFTASGSFTCPSGVTTVNLLLVGGGGGGGGGAQSATSGGGGGGAGAKGYVFGVSTTPFSVYSVVVGAGGIGGTTGTSGNPGGTGGISSFTALVVYSVSGGNGGSGGTNSIPGAGGIGGSTFTNIQIYQKGVDGNPAVVSQGGDGGSGEGSTIAGNGTGNTGGEGYSGGGGGSGLVGNGGVGAQGYVLIWW